jgi:hypothetical protein
MGKLRSDSVGHESDEGDRVKTAQRWLAGLLTVAATVGTASALGVSGAHRACVGSPTSYVFRTVDATGHVDTGLHGVSDRGRVAGYFDDGAVQGEPIAYPTGFVRWHGKIRPVRSAADIYSDLNDVNDAGDAVGYHGHVGTIANSAFLYELRSNTSVPLVFSAPVRTTIAAGINDRGTIVGTLNVDPTGLPQNADHKGYLKRRGQVSTPAYELVSYPGAPETFGNGINDNGAVVGNYETRRGDVTSSRSFVRARGAYRTLDLHRLCAVRSEAWGISNRGDVVGFYSDATGAVHGYLSTRTGSPSRIDVPRADATLVYSITARGVLYGTYDTRGVAHGFIATPARRVR